MQWAISGLRSWWANQVFFPPLMNIHYELPPSHYFGDPLATTLAEGIDIGLLGIELHSRRRNRLNGTITAIHADSFDVYVGQSFGNCPQYIQARMFELVESDATRPQTVHQFTTLGSAERAIITAADTFFIATAYQAESAGAARGVDVSHRGGKPGFVRIDDDGTLTIPDFSGNCHFNTFGNLELNPRAGLLFVDFDSGDLLYLTGTAEVIWEGTEAINYEGAERLFRFRLDRGYRIENSLPLRWSKSKILTLSRTHGFLVLIGFLGGDLSSMFKKSDFLFRQSCIHSN